MFWVMKTIVLRDPMAFSNFTVSTRGQGFSINVLLGHTFFYLIWPVTRTRISWNTKPTTCALGRWATACASKHVLSAWRRTPHFTHAVQGHLDQRFGQMWTDRGGPIAWPARSPDLTPLDYFLWGHMKSLVYETPVDSEEDLLARVMAAADMLDNKVLMIVCTRT